MEIDEKYVQAVRDRLNEYREKSRDIDNQVERLERLQAKMYGVGSQNLSDMPKSPSPSNDRMTDMVSQKEELEQLIREDVEAQSQERKFIEDAMKHIRKSDEKAVIRMRYFDGYSWNDVRDMLFGHKEDYDEKLDSYQRRTFGVHRCALHHLAEYIYRDELLDTAISTG